MGMLDIPRPEIGANFNPGIRGQMHFRVGGGTTLSSLDKSTGLSAESVSGAQRGTFEKQR